MKRLRMLSLLVALLGVAMVPLRAAAAARVGTKAIIRVVTLGAPPTAMALDSSTRHVFFSTVSAAGNGSVEMYDVDSWTLLRSSTVGVQPQWLYDDAHTGRVFVGNGGRAIFGRGVFGTSVSVLDSRSGRLLRTIAVSSWPCAVAADNRLNHIYLGMAGGVGAQNGNPQSGAVGIVDARTGAVLREVVVGRGPCRLTSDERTGRVFLIDNGMSGVANVPSDITVLDGQTGAIVRTVSRRGIEDIAASAQSGRVFAAYFDVNSGIHCVSMLDGTSGAILHTTNVGVGNSVVLLDTHRNRILAIKTGGVRNAISVLDATSGVVRQTVHIATTGPEAVNGAVADLRRARVYISSTRYAGPFNAAGLGSVRVLDTGRNVFVRNIAVGARPDALAVDEQTGRLLVLNRGGQTPQCTQSGKCRPISVPKVMPATIRVIDPDRT